MTGGEIALYVVSAVLVLCCCAFFACLVCFGLMLVAYVILQVVLHLRQSRKATELNAPDDF